MGFNQGDGVNFFSLPGSGSESVLMLSETSNIATPGLWVYRVDFSVQSGSKFSVYGLSGASEWLIKFLAHS